MAKDRFSGVVINVVLAFIIVVPEEIIHEYYVIDDEGWDEYTM